MEKSQIETSGKIKALAAVVPHPVTPEGLVGIRAHAFSGLDFRPYDETSCQHEASIRWRRTAAQILDDGYVYQSKACTDLVVVFLAACRAAGLETRFVKLKNGSMVHSVAEVRLEDGWYAYDVATKGALPRKGEITASAPFGNWTLWCKGRDAWDMGLTKYADLGKIV